LLLVNSNVEEVQLKVGKLEDEAFDEDRAVKELLDAVILESSGVDCNLAEVSIHDGG